MRLRGRGSAVLAASAAAVLLVGCELQELTIARPEPLLVAEAYLLVGDGEDDVTAFLHSTLGSGDIPNLLASSVRVTRGDTFELVLDRFPSERCLLPDLAEVVDGVCFAPVDPVEGVFQPGDRVELEISTPDGRELRGATVVPRDFRFLRPRNLDICALPPGRTLTLTWNRAEGAWAYAGEAIIWGLRDALAPQGVQVGVDSLALLGLAISESDTTIAFPGEFGVFNRFDLERDVALALQEGLPKGAVADVAVAAVDRNYVNWVRGGAFNPSGPVRIPSLVGDGTGAVGSVVRKVVRILGMEPIYSPASPIPSCFTG